MSLMPYVEYEWSLCCHCRQHVKLSAMRFGYSPKFPHHVGVDMCVDCYNKLKEVEDENQDADD